MASVFLYHVVGDLTVGKPVMVEFSETETVEAAIRVIGESTEGGIPIWKKRSHKIAVENAEMRQQRFLGILNPLDIVAFLARDSCLEDQEKALRTPVSEVVIPNNSLLKEVDPGTRLVNSLSLSLSLSCYCNVFVLNCVINLIMFCSKVLFALNFCYLKW